MRVGLIGAGRMGSLHAAALAALAGVSELVVADADAARARAVADRLGAASSPVDELFAGRVEALVIAAPTDAHAGLVHRAVEAGLPTLCEKPLAADVEGTIAVVEHARAAGVSLQVGFMRRFDPGYRAAREAVAAGRLGRVHTLRAVTCDPAPPPAAYIATSGGIFRDCHIHDFDVVRFVTGREIVTVYATGSNAGEAFFAAAGDVDTAAAICTLDDGALATVTGTRYNGAGYDVRLEVAGSAGMLAVGLDDHAPLRSAEAGVAFPPGPAYPGFLERFGAAYAAELEAFVEHALGRIPNACPPGDALEALYVAEAAELSRSEGRAVALQEVRQGNAQRA